MVAGAAAPAAAAAAVTRQAPGPVNQNETADLLEALRRRRGEREAASFSTDGDEEFDSLSLTRGSSGGGYELNRSEADARSDDLGRSEEQTRPVAHLTRSGSSSSTGSESDTSSNAGVTTLEGFDDVPDQRQTGPQSRSKRRTASQTHG